MLSLSIQHNICLTREEAYALHRGEEIVVNGCSVPVWHKDGVSSEPAKEVFCRYVLRNIKEESPVKIIDCGYDIVIPFREATSPDITTEEWKKLKKENPEKLEEIYSKTISEVSSKNLLDEEDGGNRRLIYREHSKVKKGSDSLKVIHYVNITREEEIKDI